jgi:hypothetical protein
MGPTRPLPARASQAGRRPNPGRSNGAPFTERRTRRLSLPRLGRGEYFLGFAFKPKSVTFEKAAQAFEVLSSALLGGTFQHGQSDGNCNYPRLEAGVSQET